MTLVCIKLTNTKQHTCFVGYHYNLSLFVCTCGWQGGCRSFTKSSASSHLSRPVLFSWLGLNPRSICINRMPPRSPEKCPGIDPLVASMGLHCFLELLEFYVLQSRPVIYFGFLQLWSEVWILGLHGSLINIQWSQHPQLRRRPSLVKVT